MALIECPECEARISDKAPACVKCGYVLQAPEPEPVRTPSPVAVRAPAPIQAVVEAPRAPKPKDEVFPEIRRIFSDDVVSVTERSVTIEGLTIRVPDITSVRAVKLPKENGCLGWMVGLGGLFLIASIGMFRDGGELGPSLLWGAISTVVLAWGVLGLMAPPEFVLHISTAQGLKSALERKPKAYVELIQSKITDAMDGRFGDHRNIVDSSR